MVKRLVQNWLVAKSSWVSLLIVAGALFGSGCAHSNGFSTTPKIEVLNSPSSLTATAISSVRIDLFWTAPAKSATVSGYRVERCQGVGCSSFTQVAAPATTTFSDTGLVASTSYSYRVRATDPAGNLSGFSNTATIATLAAPDTTPPSAPTNLTGTAASSTQINLTWSASTDNVGVTGYRVERCQGAGCSSFTQIGTPTTKGFTDAGLSASTSYRYRVRAADAAGNLSDFSNIAQISSGPPPLITVSLKPTLAPVTTGQAQKFIVTVTGSSAGVIWQVDTVPGGNTAIGTIDGSGQYIPPLTGGTHTITAVSQEDVTKSASATVAVTDLPGVFTYHNDISRSGTNPKEYALTPATVNTATFGKLFSCPVDGTIYAQPLWMANLPLAGGTHNVVFVATQRDTVYAFDADAPSCINYWTTGANGVNSLVPAGETWATSADVGCGDLEPDIGIVGTPVIDPATRTLYLVTKTKNGNTFHQRLHALDLTTGAEKISPPTEIQAKVPGTGNGSTGGMVSFDALLNNQRSALLLENGHVIISWASHCDNGPYLGWMMSYSASSLAQEAVFNASPNGQRSGIWMSGSGPAADATGNLFFATGNGSWDGSSNFGDSVVRLSPPTGGGFPSLDYFTPIDQANLNTGDIDLGSGGVLLLPDQPSAPHPQLLVQAGKEGTIYLLDRTNLGKMCTTCTSLNTQIVQELPSAVGRLWGSPAYWNGLLFYGGSDDNLKSFSFNSGSLAPVGQSGTGIFRFPGSTPSVSASGTTNGIVWAVDVSQYCTEQSPACAAALLHAYNANNLATEYWNSSLVSGDVAGNAVKFTVPTVANGKVYIGTRGNDCGPASPRCTSTPTPVIRGEMDVYGVRTP